MSKNRKKRSRHQTPLSHGAPPAALDRAPRVDLKISMAELDGLVFSAVDAVASALKAQVEQSRSMANLQLLTTETYLLLAMKSTHRSIHSLMAMGGEKLDQTVDALPLTRVQLERCFLALLFEDNPARWHARYRKNAWKAFAEKFFRDRCAVGHIEPYSAYFAPDGPGISALRAFARQMDVGEDEFQTLRSQVLDERERDPRFENWFIADMPTPGRCVTDLTDPTRKKLAELLYPHYDNLSHFSHGGMVGVMEAAILRADREVIADAGFDRQQFWTSAVMETSLPLSYVAVMFVATLLAAPAIDDQAMRQALIEAWRPYLSDGVPMGVAVWDAWAGDVLTAAGDGR